MVCSIIDVMALYTRKVSKKYMIYVLFKPSQQMLKDKNIPKVFIEKTPASQLKKRDKDVYTH